MNTGHRVAIVTGASRGIGRAIALRLAADGARVAINYASHGEAAAEVAEKIAGAGGEAMLIQADIADPQAAGEIVRQTLARWRHIDIVVNNAGISSNDTSIADTDFETWQRMLDINLNGAFHMVRAVIPHMRERRVGHIVNLSSNVTQRMPASFGPYTVSKSALEALTRILAKEEGRYGIRVNAIAPGPIMTEMLAALLQEMGEDKARAFVQSVPLGRTGEPEEIAAMVAMLVSATASFLTGQVIYVNGGGPGG